MKTVQAQIKQYLEDNGIKQTWLQKQLNISLPALNALLNEKRGMTADEYFKICSVLKLPTDHFKAVINN
jgi:plasmid maintenance system antidote protein VapI